MSNEPKDLAELQLRNRAELVTLQACQRGVLKPKQQEQIMLRVNSHDALVEALETVLANAPEPYCAITRAVDRQVREALAAARGEL